MSGVESALIKAGAPAARSVVGLLWKWLRPDTSPQALDTHADSLAAKVELAESEQLVQLGVAIGEAVDVSFSFLVHARRDDDREFASIPEIGEYYRSLTPGRLAVIGEPGSGKTVTLLLLELDLLIHRRNNPDQTAPVPVRVNAASWDVTLGFESWLTDRLERDYRVPSRIGRMLVRTGRVIPFIDGLDEMDSDDETPLHAREAFDRLNEMQWRSKRIVIACRANTYMHVTALAKDAGLHRSSAIRLRSLTSEEILAHLDRCLVNDGVIPDAWSPVTATVRNQGSGPMAEAFRTPWMLTLATTFLRRGRHEAAELLASASSVDKIEDILLTAFIPTAIEGLPRGTKGGRAYTESQVKVWLTNLATHLQEQRIRGMDGSNIAAHELIAMAGWRGRWVENFVRSMVTCLVIAVAFGITLGPAYGLPVCVMGGPLFGAALSLADMRSARATSDDPQYNAVAQLAGRVGLKRSPISEIKSLVEYPGIVVTLLMFAMPALFALQRWVDAGVHAAIVAWATFTIAMLILLVIKAGVDHQIQAICTVLAFAGGATFSRKPKTFLKWAEQAGLLRMTGNLYQFRHQTFQEWLTVRSNGSPCTARRSYPPSDPAL